MSILNLEQVSKTFGAKKILENVSWGMESGDKVGIIGINGTGKTTLLHILAGMEEPDEGKVVRQNGLKIGYLPQNPEFPEGVSVRDYVADSGRYDVWSAESLCNHLGLTDHEAPVSQLSGGQKKRAALARTLLEPADLLILDEPTNHLDAEMIAWLENTLRRFKGAVLLVTHDRYFLDQVTDHILEISRGSLYAYEANYTRFLELKAEREERELAGERKRQSILRMELEWAKRGCRARTTKQKARLARLEALKNGKAPETDQTVEMDSAETRMGKKTVELHHIRKAYGDRVLIDDFDYIFLKNQKIGIIGPNGCGKSTLLKILAGELLPDSGSVEVGETVRMSYFAQEVPELDPDERVIDYVKNIAEYVQTRNGRITASQMLERFLFPPEMQYAPIGKLSGGEKRRLYLLSVLQTGPNVLIMDEVSNEIDIPTLTILEDYLNSFSGIVVMVSHDRYFLDDVVDRIFEFDGEGHLQQYEGGYTDYREAKARRQAAAEAGGDGKTGAPEKRKESGKKETARGRRPDRPEKLKFTYKEQREFETIEETIAGLEEKLGVLEAEMLANATNSLRLNELMAEKERAEAELEEKMERWVYLNDLAERIEEQKTCLP